MNQVSSSVGSPAPPKTARGRKTRDRLLAAAEREFGEKGFHEAGISGISQRAGVALGTFYVYFKSKEEIFRALVDHMGRRTRAHLSARIAEAENRLEAERLGLEAFIEFVREHHDLYRIVMESQFVAEDAYRAYYLTFVEAYRRNLADAARTGEIRSGDEETRAWALVGMSVFLGMRYGVWDKERSVQDVARGAYDLIARGLAP